MAVISHTEAGGQNVLAFLDMIAVAEGTSTSPATKLDGYDIIVMGADKKWETFSDFSTHPFANGRPSKLIRTNSNGSRLTSNASGRYQFMLRDWDHYRRQLRLPDFGPLSQDKWAIQLIRERRALDDIKFGRFSTAVHKVKNIWASMPGAGYGQPEKKLDTLIAAYQKAGGTLA